LHFTLTLRQFSYSLVVIVLLLAILSFAAGELLSRPVRKSAGRAPQDIKVQTVILQTLANQSVSGWFIQGRQGQGAVLLLHGVRGHRLDMLERARFLNKAGYSVMLIDLPAHGESTGNRISFGFHEAQGVTAALRYLTQQLPDEKIAIIGVSLGAASVVFASMPAPPSAVVLESLFPSITEALIDRFSLHMGVLGTYFAPLLLWQLPYKIGVSAKQLRPIAAISTIHAPVLIASGSKDQHTTRAETSRLFQAANAPKELWIIKGAGHEDLHTFDRQIYETRILIFLAKYMQPH
jgi:uncharacterized protein